MLRTTHGLGSARPKTASLTPASISFDQYKSGTVDFDFKEMPTDVGVSSNAVTASAVATSSSELNDHLHINLKVLTTGNNQYSQLLTYQVIVLSSNSWDENVNHFVVNISYLKMYFIYLFLHHMVIDHHLEKYLIWTCDAPPD